MASLNASQITGRGWSALMSAMLCRLGQVTRIVAPQRWRANQAWFHPVAAAPSQCKHCGGPITGGVRGTVAAEMQARSLSTSSPLAAGGLRQSDLLPRFFITDSTLREGEQFATGDFSTQDRIYLAKLLDGMGVDYIELVNPMASDTAMSEIRQIADMGLRANIAVHIRCAVVDVEAAVASGADAVNIYMATSEALREHSHGKGIEAVIEQAGEVLRIALAHGLEVRFSCEDAFRSDVDEIIQVYNAVVEMGAHRVGLADTVGVATPAQVKFVTERVRAAVGPDIGINFHTHNDTGCCIANAFVALEAGATHIDTTILGIGERNGITPLGGLLARLYTIDPDYVKQRFRLDMLGHLERYVASSVKISVPFNNYITGSAAYCHKAGVHSKAVMANPTSYEVINPEDFGVCRQIQLAHRLIGWNGLSARARELELDIADDLIKMVTKMIKNLADSEKLSLQQVDHVLLSLHKAPKAGFTLGESTDDEVMAGMFKDVQDAMIRFQEAVAQHAIATIPRVDTEAGRLSRVVQIKGHLFDTTVLNRIMDFCVDSPCTFNVLSLDIPNNNAELSITKIRFWANVSDELDGAMDDMVAILADDKFRHAECTLGWVDLDELQ